MENVSQIQKQELFPNRPCWLPGGHRSQPVRQSPFCLWRPAGPAERSKEQIPRGRQGVHSGTTTRHCSGCETESRAQRQLGPGGLHAALASRIARHLALGVGESWLLSFPRAQAPPWKAQPQPLRCILHRGAFLRTRPAPRWTLRTAPRSDKSTSSQRTVGLTTKPLQAE